MKRFFDNLIDKFLGWSFQRKADKLFRRKK